MLYLEPGKRKDTYENIDILEDEFIFLIEEFCQLHRIEDMTKESQNRFNAALTYVFNHKIKSRYNLMVENDNYNTIDINKLSQVYNIYNNICNIYNKEISISSFCYLCGLSCYTFENWLYNYDNQYSITGESKRDKLNILRREFMKNIQRDNENSLQNLLTSGKVNPVGVLAVLNHSHGWNLPGVSREVAKPALTAENLPKLSNNLPPNEPLNCLPNANNSEYVKSTQNQGFEQS